MFGRNPKQRPVAEPPSPEARRARAHRRYETLIHINDAMIAIWFLVGSLFFFYPALIRAGILLFVIGSAQLLLKLVLQLLQRRHSADQPARG